MYAARYAAEHPDRPALIMATSGDVVTFAEYEAAANRMAHLYRDEGLQLLDHVAFFMENNPRMLECEGGAERTGLYYTCINSYLAPDEAAYIVNDSQARIVVTSEAKREVAAQLPAMCPGVRRWIMAGTDSPPPPYEPYDAAVAGYPSTPVPDERLGAAMLYSSGTTGRPKGILRPIPDTPASIALPLLDGLKVLWGFREGMVYLSPAPLYHSAPQASVASSLRLGATSVIMSTSTPPGSSSSWRATA